MFEKKIGIIYLTKSKIYYTTSTQIPYNITELSWDGTDLTSFFQKIKNTDKLDSVKIVLGDDLTYVLVTKIPSSSLDRANISRVISGLIPEEITDTNFDYRIVGKINTTNTALVQIFAIPQKILFFISYAAKLAKLPIYFIHPVSILLAEALKSMTSPNLILWSRQEKLGIVSYQGSVYITENILGKTDEAITSLLDYVKSNFGIIIDTMIVDWTNEVSPLNLSKVVNLNIKKIDLDVIMLALNKKSDKGADKDILQIKPLENPIKPETTLSTAMKPDSKSSQPHNITKSNKITSDYNLLIIIIVVLCVAIIIGVIIFLII